MAGCRQGETCPLEKALSGAPPVQLWALARAPQAARRPLTPAFRQHRRPSGRGNEWTHGAGTHVPSPWVSFPVIAPSPPLHPKGVATWEVSVHVEPGHPLPPRQGSFPSPWSLVLVPWPPATLASKHPPSAHNLPCWCGRKGALQEVIPEGRLIMIPNRARLQPRNTKHRGSTARTLPNGPV